MSLRVAARALLVAWARAGGVLTFADVSSFPLRQDVPSLIDNLSGPLFLTDTAN
jgi:hypothetical protein